MNDVGVLAKADDGYFKGRRPGRFFSTKVQDSAELSCRSLIVTMAFINSIAVILLSQWTLAPLVACQSSSASPTPVTTTALPGSDTPRHHWRPDRPDQYVCEYLGENDCWQPSIIQEGPPYNGFESRPHRHKKCIVKAGNDPSKDDAPAIRHAFKKCHENAHIVFENTTYYIHTVMNTTGLKNVDVEVLGTLYSTLGQKRTIAGIR
jgi:hypothetical protein